MAVRSWYMAQALKSVAQLNSTLLELTEEEVLACLDLESQSARRKSIVTRLLARAVRLNELAYVAALKLKYCASCAQPNQKRKHHGTHPIENLVPIRNQS